MFADYAFGKRLPIASSGRLVRPYIPEHGMLTRWWVVNAHNALFSGSAGPVGADEDDFHALQRRKEDVIREEQHEEKLAKVGSLHVRKNPRVVQF